jgi:hypothetical protein
LGHLGPGWQLVMVGKSLKTLHSRNLPRRRWNETSK